MALTILHSLPNDTLTQGDTFLLSLSADPSASVTVDILGPTKPSALTGTADAVTGELDLSADTTSWTPGNYFWEAKEDSAGVIGRLDRQSFLLVAALSSLAAGTDLRSTAKQAVDALEASLSNTATSEVWQYKINNRELRRYSLKERLDLLSYWKRRYQGEVRRSKGRNPISVKIGVRI